MRETLTLELFSLKLRFDSRQLKILAVSEKSISHGFAGKVHGSLARAGKVRGQTPKVAKQDKKKKPRGRAHKRMQYNRRFVTAVVGFGKKRGPNSSEK
ncbi:UNVERIFIED_CONTAM: 40S ribosomal protein S30 [Sesamum radiatum]|uniref:40S ribosomal protein S30 n=1 Tax=Sesamum radiatum TaxID=300843 RepID=A0AAW2R2W0_SESRA